MGHCFEITLWLPFGHEDEHEVPYGENRNLDPFLAFILLSIRKRIRLWRKIALLVPKDDGKPPPRDLFRPNSIRISTVKFLWRQH